MVTQNMNNNFALEYDDEESFAPDAFGGAFMGLYGRVGSGDHIRCASIGLVSDVAYRGDHLGNVGVPLWMGADYVG